MRTIFLLALFAPTSALAATTGTVTVLLKNTGAGSFGSLDPVRVIADADFNAYDKSVDAPTSGTAGPNVAFQAQTSGLYTYSGFQGTYQFSATFPDASGTRTYNLASNVRFPGTGTYWLSKLGVTTTNPGPAQAFEIANTAPAPLSINGCYPNVPNPTQNLYVYWSIGSSRPTDFDRYLLQRAPVSGSTWTTIGTYPTWGPANFTDTNLTPGTTYRYRVAHQDRYDAITPGPERTCTTASGDSDADGQVSTAYGGTDCNDTNASIYQGAPEVPNDGIDQDCDGRDLVQALDRDGDGLVDPIDNCPDAPNKDQANLDLDKAGDACDPDDDNDGVADIVDVCPRWADASQLDLDGDLAGDVCDDDDDDDGVDDVADVCPTVVDPDQWDLDHDLLGDACDGDDDGDTVGDLVDVCPTVADPDQVDTDGDTIGDACDPDIDGDLLVDTEDNCPFDSNEDQLDTDADTAGDACDVDDDNDGVGDDTDLCPVNADPLQEDADTDSLGNACDEDDDNDDVLDEDDNCVFAANVSQADLDGDTTGDACDDDDDNDGVDDSGDNCVVDANADQLDNDLDGAGDTCDADDDDDGWSDADDNCTLLVNADQADLDGDTLGDVCDPDDDDDLAWDLYDNCPVEWNEDQLDTDADGDGDVCDMDDDDDGVGDEDDLCATVSDPDQSDRDCDGGGDACDDDADGDSVPDDLDACPDAAAFPIELVEDGCPDDACDLDVWISARGTSEISAQMVRSLRAQASGACADAGTTAGINKLGALANHVAAQSGKKVSAETAELLLGSIDWIETAWTCESSGAGCDALDPCGE
jgi:hypothetical protein